MKRILSLHISAPGMGIFAETGIFPAKDQIARKNHVPTQNIEWKPGKIGAPNIHTTEEVLDCGYNSNPKTIAT